MFVHLRSCVVLLLVKVLQVHRLQEDDMTRQTNTLPTDEAARLVALREAGPSQLPALRGRVKALREAGWSLAAIGAPLGANRSTTRMWELGAKTEDVTTAS